jgi:hypothetical protein
MNTFIFSLHQIFYNTTQLLEGKKKLTYIIRLKAFLFELDNILCSKYKNMLCLADVRLHFVVF